MERRFSIQAANDWICCDHPDLPGPAGGAWVTVSHPVLQGASDTALGELHEAIQGAVDCWHAKQLGVSLYYLTGRKD